MIDTPQVPETDRTAPPLLGPRERSARQAKRMRAKARVDAAQRQMPALEIERSPPILAILRLYREHRVDEQAETSPLAGYIRALEREVSTLERWAESLGSRAHEEGPTIRRALGFLRTFSRIMSLDFTCVPVEERDQLVALLALEHRWCYAAAGTTRDVFKIAIGRTGAR